MLSRWQRWGRPWGLIFIAGATLGGVMGLGAQAKPGAAPAMPAAPAGPQVLELGTWYDGLGHIHHGGSLIVENGKIARIEIGPAPAPAGAAVVDLRDETVMPGWIDMHVHITYHFGPNGKYGERPDPDAYEEIEQNAAATLLAGFTTVQSLAPQTLALETRIRGDVAADKVVGPRILSSLTPFQLNTRRPQTPEQLRQQVDTLKQQGADVVKIFASDSIRTGAQRTFNDGQLAAICEEAKVQSLRTVVHAYKDAVRAATLAGCTEVEHGTFATPADLQLMAARGVIFDPQVGLVIHNYLDHRAQFLGAGGFTEDGFTAMENALPINRDLFKEAIATPGLVVVFGTDAVAGAHGRNAEEFIYRVQDGGQKTMDALVSAQSVAAAALRLGDRLGRLAPGYDADVIAVKGDPLADITAVREVEFVMKGGRIYKQ